jgi:WD40 repeat protein
LLLPEAQPLELLDLKRQSAWVPLTQIGTSAAFLGAFGTNILCHWNGTNQILVHELRGGELIQRGAISLDSGVPPAEFTYNVKQQSLAWTEANSAGSIHLSKLETPEHRIELKSEGPGVALQFSENGSYLAALRRGGNFLRVWNVETGEIIVSSGGEQIRDAIFAARDQVLVVIVEKGRTRDHELVFYDLRHAHDAPRRVAGRTASWHLAVSPDGGLVAASTQGGQVRLFDPGKGELVDVLHGHLNSAFGVAFSPDGRRLISGAGGREAVKLWDVGTHQELLTLGGTGSILDGVRWSADGDVILAGSPWQSWRAPSWEEIAAAEGKERAGTKQP